MDEEKLGRLEMTTDELLALPAVVDLETAGRAWKMGPSKARELARDENFPCRVLRVGQQWRVRKADLLPSLGYNLDGTPAVSEQARAS